VSRRAAAPVLWTEAEQSILGDHSNCSGSKAVEAGIKRVLERLACPRCSVPLPPLPRWPGDRWTADVRPPHSCGLPMWSR
jgi:hypothetical protein